MVEYWQAVRAFSPSLRRFLLALGLMATAIVGLQAVLLNLYLLRLGFDARFIGLLVGLGQVVWAVAALPAGALSHRIGLRNGLQLGLGLVGFSFLLLLVVERLPQPLWRAWLLSSEGVLNLGAAFITVAMAPYLMAVTGERERPYAFAAMEVLFPLTALLGSLLGGLLPGLWAHWLGLTLDEPAPYRLALWLGPLLVGLSLLPLLGAEPARVAAQSGGRNVHDTDAARLPLGLLVWFGSVVLLSSIGIGAVNTFFNVYLDRELGVDPALIGTVMGLSQMVAITAALAVPLPLKRWGSGYTLVGGILGLALGLLPLALLPLLGVAALAYTGVTAAGPVIFAARDLFGQELVIPRWRTTSQAVVVTGSAVGLAAAAIAGGLLVERIGFGALYAASTLAALLAVGLLVGYLRRADVAGVAPAQPEQAVP